MAEALSSFATAHARRWVLKHELDIHVAASRWSGN